MRKGTNEWTCLPGVPGYSHDEPGCFDPIFMQWMKDSLAGKDPHIETVGIAYMYVGAWVPNLSGPGTKTQDFHVGPHIMIVSPTKINGSCSHLAMTVRTECLTWRTSRMGPIFIS